MIEIKANIWDSQFDGYWRVIPINTTLNKNGFLIMGAGLAKEAAERYIGLAKLWGSYYSLKPETLLQIFYAKKLLGLPTKYHWKDRSSLELIERILIELQSFISVKDDSLGTICPQLGCGLGGLDWKSQVKPLVEKYFKNADNFIVVNL